jgi:hypothetical protein
LASLTSCRISRSKLTHRFPARGCRMMSVACSPDRAASMDFDQALCQRVSNSTRALATLLYILTIRFASLLPCMREGCALKRRMGSSIRRSSSFAHRMLPITGAALRSWTSCDEACQINIFRVLTCVPNHGGSCKVDTTEACTLFTIKAVPFPGSFTATYVSSSADRCACACGSRDEPSSDGMRAEIRTCIC